MNESPPESVPQPAPPELLELTEQHLSLLMSEADRMQTLYLEARSSIQSVFNFYLTFITAVVGAVVFVLQIGGEVSPIQSTVTLATLLLFSALVGSVYMGALAARYASSSRYAYALDTLRRTILSSTSTPLPSLYDEFMQLNVADSEAIAWYVWLFPTGTYQMFMGFVNSVSLGLFVWLMAGLGDAATSVVLLASLFAFIVMLTIFNVYSRLTVNRFNRVIDVRVDLSNTLMLWSARQ